MTDDTVVPVLPCGSLEQTLDFYRALGFDVTFQQTWPYVYAAVSRSGAVLHFYGGFKMDPAKAFSTCLVMVENVEDPHVAGLKHALGKLPAVGLPRITRLRKSDQKGHDDVRPPEYLTWLWLGTSQRPLSSALALWRPGPNSLWRWVKWNAPAPYAPSSSRYRCQTRSVRNSETSYKQRMLWSS